MTDTDTDTTPTAEPRTDPTDLGSATAEDSDHDTDTDTDDKAAQSNEAARYRRRLRDTEAERDALHTRLTHLQRGEVERLATDRLADPADIWRDGATLDNVLNDDGNIDPTKVNELLTGLLKSHAHWGIPKSGDPARKTGIKSGASAPNQPRPNQFTESFAPRNH